MAWDAPEPRLMKMMNDGEDIHKFVAGSILKKPVELVAQWERDKLGKKVGHASNYGTGAHTFAEQCLVEANYYISIKESQHALDTYFEIFPGIRIRQDKILRV